MFKYGHKSKRKKVKDWKTTTKQKNQKHENQNMQYRKTLKPTVIFSMYIIDCQSCITYIYLHSNIYIKRIYLIQYLNKYICLRNVVSTLTIFQTHTYSLAELLIHKHKEGKFIHVANELLPAIIMKYRHNLQI